MVMPASGIFSTKLVTPMKTETGIHAENMLTLKPDM
jgi:hypothetical protein